MRLCYRPLVCRAWYADMANAVRAYPLRPKLYKLCADTQTFDTPTTKHAHAAHQIDFVLTSFEPKPLNSDKSHLHPHKTVEPIHMVSALPALSCHITHTEWPQQYEKRPVKSVKMNSINWIHWLFLIISIKQKNKTKKQTWGKHSKKMQNEFRKSRPHGPKRFT